MKPDRREVHSTGSDASMRLKQSRTQYLASDPDMAHSSVMSYDIYGGLQNNGLQPPGTHIDAYA